MANSKVTKEIQSEVPKKGRRRLKRSVRKTFGALFLASAIAVAAIPTEGLQAAEAKTKLAWATEIGSKPGTSVIPLATKDDPIYTTEDGTFQFAWHQVGVDWIAIILGYTSGTLDNNELVIPDTVDAYTRYNPNDGSADRYVAVSRSKEPLYYRVLVSEAVVSGGDTVKEAEYNYIPCYNSTRSEWGYTDEDKTVERSMEDFWYKDGEEYKPTTELDHQWIRNITVKYIGNQYLAPDSAQNGAWELAKEVESTYNTDPSKGIFSGNTNIRTLTVGENLEGIGNYAFYNCASLSTIKLGNGIKEIGHSAFQNCIQMTSISIPFASNLQYISDYTFAGCRDLQSFTLPTGVTKIYDHAFDGCSSLRDLNLSGIMEENVLKGTLLEEIGYYAFANCTSLENLTLPSNFSNAAQENTLHLNNFAGCTGLKHIEVLNPNLKLTADEAEEENNYTVAQFKSQVDPTFYFEADDISGTHNYTKENMIAFKYSGQDLYELIVLEPVKAASPEGDKAKLTYQVNSSNELVYFEIEKGKTVEEVTIPATIGPYGIATLGSDSFSKKGESSCALKRIIIPSTVKKIETGAFEGCHDLAWVIFNDPDPALTIEHNAFQTQVVEPVLCTHSADLNDKTPELHFVGPISGEAGLSAPFAYAMTRDETIDNDNQPTTYITYHSGWPSNLEVQYNPATQRNELIDYPTLTTMAEGKYKTEDYPYLTQSQATNIQKSVESYQTSVSNGDRDPLLTMNTDEAAAIKAAKDLYLPEGITGIKENLFVEKEDVTENLKNVEKTITADGLIDIAPGTFKGHENLVGVFLNDATESIGEYAFEDCKNLTTVSLPGTVNKLGTRPFKGCEKLSSVDFNGGPYFTCDRGIIYELSDAGTKEKLVEFLEGRTNPLVTAEETAGVTALYPEAFADTGVSTVDLSQTSINTVPEGAFYHTEDLVSVILPRQMDGGTIADGAFADSSVRVLTIPGKYLNMTEKAFTGTEKYANQADNYPDRLIFVCEPDGMADTFAKQHGIQSEAKEPEIYYQVSFWYYDDDNVPRQIGEAQEVQLGHSAQAPTPPAKTGYTFLDWQPNTWQSVSENEKYYANYVKNDTVMYNVVFQDYNGKEISRQTVAAGGSAIIPQNPYREGYKFDGWMLSGGDGAYVTSLSNVQSDMTLIAQYHQLQEGEDPDDTPFPSGSGSPNPGGNSGSPAPGGSSSPSPGANGPLYTLTVQNGSGSGSYAAGAQPVIIANDPARGQVFDYWSVSPEDVKIASTVLSASIITMPAKDVTVTAHYKAGSANSSSGGGGTGSGNNAVRPNRNVSELSNGTTVVIDKNGLSNTGVVSATVHGSSDNFTIKISESDAATAAALRALMAEYGSLDNIKYFPMDISLYDSTGTTKITDTTGLTVDITLPIPDSLITYAGNNRVASVANDRLERLGARFTTIQGVSCVTFTAEHFSPYMIYVDTGDLSAGNVSDSTPKTGDFIHPKWFLSIGLACLSFVLFVQKDGIRKPKKVKVKAG